MRIQFDYTLPTTRPYLIGTILLGVTSVWTTVEHLYVVSDLAAAAACACAGALVRTIFIRSELEDDILPRVALSVYDTVRRELAQEDGYDES